MPFKFFFVGLLFSVLFSLDLSAQSSDVFMIQGRVMIAGVNGGAAENTIIRSSSSSDSLVADKGGYFHLSAIPKGWLKLSFNYIGCKPWDTSFFVKKNMNLLFILKPQYGDLNNVTVTSVFSAKSPIATLIRTDITGEAIEQTRGFSLGESLKSIAGVNSIQTGPSISKPIIHGLYSNRILILNNGIRQEGQNWGNDHAPEIDPFIATRLSVIKGAASVRYGSDAIGGVILVDPRAMPTVHKLVGDLNMVGMSNGRIGVLSGSLEEAESGKLEGLSWRVQGTLKKAGNARSANYFMGNTGFYEKDYSLTLNYRRPSIGGELYYSHFLSKIGIATASVIGTLQDLLSAFQRSQPADTADFTYRIGRPYQTIDHELFKASSYLVLHHGLGKLEATYAFQRDVRKEYDADISFNDSLAKLNLPDLYFRLNTSTVDAVWQHPDIFRFLSGSLGLNFITHGNLQQGTGYQELIPNFVDYGGGAFLIEKASLGHFLLEGAIRYDYKWLQAYTVDTKTLTKNTPTYIWQNSTANLGATYLSGPFSVTFNFGTAWRPPQVIELFANGIHQSAASYEHGDSLLSLEKAYNNNLTFTYSIGNFRLEIGGYVNYFHHYIYLKPDTHPVETIQGAFPSYTYTQVNAIFKGLDLDLLYQFLPQLSIASKLSIVRAKNLAIHDWLINVPADRLDNTLKFERDKFLGVHHFYFSVNSLLVARQKRVPPNSDYVSPPPGYALWGISTGCSLPFKKQFIDFNFSVTNLTNVNYRDYLNRFRYYMSDLGRNIILRVTFPLDFSSSKIVSKVN